MKFIEGGEYGNFTGGIIDGDIIERGGYLGRDLLREEFIKGGTC